MAASSARADEPAARWPRVDVEVARVTGLPRLEAQLPEGWTRVGCVLPCATQLDPALMYRIAGEGVTDSDPFRIPARGDPLRVDVEPGSPMLRDLGTIFAVGGLVFAAGGGAALLYPNSSEATRGEMTAKTVIGVSFLSVGAVTTVLGLLLRSYSDTKVSVAFASGQGP
jgi:hypothetical protein